MILYCRRRGASLPRLSCQTSESEERISLFSKRIDLLRADTQWCELLSCCEEDFKSRWNYFRSRGENFARAMILCEPCVKMLVANIGGLGKLGKFWVWNIAFILKSEDVSAFPLGILCSKSKSLLKSSGLFGVTRLFVAGGSESRYSSLGKLVLAKGVLVGNRNIKDEISAL